MSVPTQIQELIDGSGNNFHAKVARWFAADGWRTTVSPYYMDQSQQKARELDLVVEKSWPVKGTFGNFYGEVVVRLFVECKFVPGYSVFWFTGKNRPAVKELVCSTGIFRANNTYTSKHHYLTDDGDRVAKLFTSSNARGQEAEPFYKALNQALNGLVTLRTQSSQTSVVDEGRRKILAVLDFPVVVCNSFANLYAADFDGLHETSEIQNNFQLEVQYAYVEPSSGSSRDELFILDFVEYDKLSLFVASIEKDALTAGFFRNDS